jgi:ABC-type transport system involved in multi-copper enzyme maturation permease subunit
MTLLPVVERELRVAARERGTYRVRFLAAFITVLFSVFSLWFVRVAFDERPLPPRELFLFLTWLSFVFVVLAGFSLTCDSICEEKRESTLGLLLLTDLKGYDVVLGKFSVAVLRGFYSLLATIPVLALPLMMGGTNLTELARVSVTLLITLLFSMTVGLLISTLSRRSWSAFGNSAAVLFIFAAALPAVGQFVSGFYRNHGLAQLIQLPSPSYAMYNSFRTAIGLSSNAYGISLATIAVLVVVGLCAASQITPRVWKDRPPARRLAGFLESFRALKFGSAEFRFHFRRRLLDCNPIYWLSRRERVSSFGILLAFSLLATIAASVGYQDWRVIGPQANEVFPVFAWLFCAAAIHALMILRVAIVAAERFGEDRRSGALELILSTPLSISSVLAGHWKGLRRYFAGPALIAFGVHVMALSYFFTIPPIVDEGVRNIGDVLAQTFQHLRGQPMPHSGWEVFMIALIILGYFPLLLLDWIAIAWLGTWCSLRSKHLIFAPIRTLFVLHVPPVICYAFIAGFFANSGFLTGGTFSDALTLYAVVVSLFLANQIICIWWSRRQIYKHFRTAATDRYQPPKKQWWWQKLTG